MWSWRSTFLPLLSNSLCIEIAETNVLSPPVLALAIAKRPAAGIIDLPGPRDLHTSHIVFAHYLLRSSELKSCNARQSFDKNCNLDIEAPLCYSLMLCPIELCSLKQWMTWCLSQVFQDLARTRSWEAMAIKTQGLRLTTLAYPELAIVPIPSHLLCSQFVTHLWYLWQIDRSALAVTDWCWELVSFVLLCLQHTSSLRDEYIAWIIMRLKITQRSFAFAIGHFVLRSARPRQWSEAELSFSIFSILIIYFKYNYKNLARSTTRQATGFTHWAS